MNQAQQAFVDGYLGKQAGPPVVEKAPPKKAINPILRTSPEYKLPGAGGDTGVAAPVVPPKTVLPTVPKAAVPPKRSPTGVGDPSMNINLLGNALNDRGEQ